jgi:hypothetical protein
VTQSRGGAKQVMVAFAPPAWGGQHVAAAQADAMVMTAQEAVSDYRSNALSAARAARLNVLTRPTYSFANQ